MEGAEEKRFADHSHVSIGLAMHNRAGLWRVAIWESGASHVDFVFYRDEAGRAQGRVFATFFFLIENVQRKRKVMISYVTIHVLHVIHVEVATYQIGLIRSHCPFSVENHVLGRWDTP